MSILCHHQARKHQLGALICRRPNPVSVGELLLSLLSFALDTFDELERIYDCFDSSHQDTLDELGLDVLIQDIRLALSLSASCLCQMRTADEYSYTTNRSATQVG